MWTHESVWSAIDALATRNGLTTSGLARKAGLDPTTFNPSKRFSNDGRPRWPSTESIAKILSATNTTLDEFFAIVRWPRPLAEAGRTTGRPLPFLDTNAVDSAVCFDGDGYPAGPDWETTDLPVSPESGHFALRLSGELAGETYRQDDLVIIAPAVEVRSGDRVLLRSVDGVLILGECASIGDAHVDITVFGGKGGRQRLPTDKISWISRISWVSQ